MVAKIDDIEFLVVQNEVEALVLESNYIKQYRPKYNVLLRDDKSYPYIKVALTEDFPVSIASAVSITMAIAILVLTPIQEQ